MPKEKLCDCGKPISQCQCKGHNHKQTKNVKKGGVPDYLSIFGDRVQQYADYKRKKQEQYTPRSLYDPFGIVVDIGDDGGLVGNASFYKPGRSRGTSMTKKEKIQMCEDCGKPEFACKCKGHQGGRSMSKSMCKCGSGMSKAMCKCSMGKRSTLSKAMCKCGSGMSKAMCKCGGMGKSMQKRRMPFPPPPPSPFGDGIKGTIMTFSGKMPGKMKDLLGLDNMFDVFKDSPMKLFGRMGKRGKKVSKVWPLPDSDFERNGGQVGPQRRRGSGIYAPFGYEAMEGYNPAENAVRQMMPTPADVAYYDRGTKEKALANAFGDLLGAYGNELGSMFGNEDWWVRTAGRADRAANNTANSIASMFPPDNPGVPRGMMKRLSKSMKMDADMAKQPQKITPKRTIRHTDKYFK